jgi:hypothetical protein
MRIIQKSVTRHITWLAILMIPLYQSDFWIDVFYKYSLKCFRLCKKDLTQSVFLKWKCLSKTFKLHNFVTSLFDPINIDFNTFVALWWFVFELSFLASYFWHVYGSHRCYSWMYVNDYHIMFTFTHSGFFSIVSDVDFCTETGKVPSVHDTILTLHSVPSA